MENIEKILKTAGLEVTAEQLTNINKAVTENYKTIVEFDKQKEKLENATKETNSVREELKTVSESLETLKKEGANVDELQGKLKAYEEAETKRKEESEKAEKHAKIMERFTSAKGENKFSHDAVEQSYSSKFLEALESEEYKGKSDVEIFQAITKDDAGAFSSKVDVNLKGNDNGGQGDVSDPFLKGFLGK